MQKKEDKGKRTKEWNEKGTDKGNERKEIESKGIKGMEKAEGNVEERRKMKKKK